MTSPPFVYLARELQKAALAVVCRPHQNSLSNVLSMTYDCRHVPCFMGLRCDVPQQQLP